MNWAALFFGFALVIIVFVYFGYPLLIGLLGRLRPKPVQKSRVQPTVTLLIAAYNEEEIILRKIENSLKLSYPRKLLEIVVVSDGSTDATASIVREFAPQGIVLHHRKERKGKGAAISRVLSLCRGEIILFSDANNFFFEDVIEKLVRNFADPTVGAVSGKKVLHSAGSELGKSENLYWRYESFIRSQESRFGSTSATLGEVLAVRRVLCQSSPEDVINDDFFFAIQVIQRGFRVVYEPEAISVESSTFSETSEITRRSRIAAGYLQSWALLPMLLKETSWWICFQIVSHKLLRPFTPIFMLVVFLTTVLLVLNGSYLPNVMLAAAGAQVLFYSLAVVGGVLAVLGKRKQLFYLPYYLCITHFAYLLEAAPNSVESEGRFRLSTILSHLSFGVHRNLVSEFGFQHPEVLVALDAPEVLLRLQEG